MEKQTLAQKIQSRAAELLPELKEIRRHIHRHPELGFEEYKTMDFICTVLEREGIVYTKGIAKTGLVGVIEGKNPKGRVIGLRADMDALPLQEISGREYGSLETGKMHACGHDAHMSSLLGALMIINEMKDEFSGKVKFFFQPSEEMFPGGAITMIDEGAMEDPKPDFMIGQHVLPTMETGKVGMKPGAYMASTDEIYLKVKGQGGHAATPELNVDPIAIAAQIITGLQQVVSRKANPAIPSVLSFGNIIGKGRTNIIPSEVRIEGTFRTFSEEWRAEAHHHIHSIAENTAQAFGGSCEVRIEKGYPFLVNDDALTEKMFVFAQEYLGVENVERLNMRMTAEDFAYFSQEVPSLFYRLGIRNEAEGITANLHTPEFDIDEESLKHGCGLMVWMALQALSL